MPGFGHAADLNQLRNQKRSDRRVEFMITPFGSGGGMSQWLRLIGLPLLVGLWARFRVRSAFKKGGEVRASSNVGAADARREILEPAQIRDVAVVETNDCLGDHYH